MAHAPVQKDIQSRLEGYPEKAQNSHHQAHCYIPALLAAVLDESPHLVAPMVQAFYHRDPLDLKACITFQHFRPGTRVMRRVPFTRCLYAQLSQQKFTPDKRSGYSMPASSNPKFKAYDLGAKLAHGAEILCSKCGAVDEEEDPLKNITADPRWSRYLTTLNAKGFFKGEMQGSRLYNKLLDDAKRYFVKSLGSNNRSSQEDSPGVQILRASKKVNCDIEEMRKEERTLLPPDDDSWLEIDPEELDAMLEKASGRPSNPAAENRQLNQMSQGMNSFMDQISGHKGVEVPKFDDTEIQFDPNSFMQSMQKVFDFEDSDGNSSSGLSEYGSEDDLEDYTPKNKAKGQGQKGSKHSSKQKTNGEDYLGIKDYMDIMDRELANTSIGQSFEKYPADKKDSSPPKAPPRKKRQAKKSGGTSPDSSASSNQSTPRHRPHHTTHRPTHAPKAQLDEEDIYDVDDLDEDFQPVNVDLNLVKNLMESYNSQGGLAGPTSNIMGSMGIPMPRDSAKHEEF